MGICSGKTEGKSLWEKIIVTAVFATQFFLMIPNIVYRLSMLNLDPSWRYFLNIANDLGLKYGKDIYFTYGPLGYICYLMNLENAFSYWLGITIWIGIFAIHILLLAWLYQLFFQNRVSFTAILISFLCYVTVYAEPERDNYQLYLLILAIVIYDLGNKKSVIITNIMLTLMFFCKFSTFTSGAAFIFVFVALQIIFTKKRESIFLILPSLFAAPIFYLLYNPSFKGLYEYVTGILRISSGWMKTQQWDDSFSRGEYLSLLAIILLYLLLVAVSFAVDYQKSAILVACSVSLFFAYKYGVTAHGIAMSIWLTAMLFSEIMLTIDFDCLFDGIGKKKGFLLFYLAAVIGCFGIAALQSVNLHNNAGKIKESFAQKARTLCSLTESSLEPELYGNTYIPQNILNIIGDATVTVYPWEIGYKAVYEELNMVYSPSIQNCNEFIPWLDEKVADYFASEEAPEYILLEDETIYFHIKYLDNPLTWEAMKDEYYAKDTQEGFCLLQKREHSQHREMDLLETEIYGITDRIVCPAGADYVKINLEYSLSGRLQEFFWRSGMTNMTLYYEDGRSDNGVIIVPNIPSGFSLDYVPQDINDVSVVLNTQNYPQISAMQLAGIGLKVLKPEIEVEWYKYRE